jgi:TetR/AcrR family transcriptional regulator, transcriptional repressor for nem operon
MSKHRKRDLAKQETREALLSAGIQEMAEKGLDLPSLDAICARAGYTRGAFYVHFKDREDFLDTVIARVLDSFLDGVIATEAQGEDLQHTIARFLSVLGAGQVPQLSGQSLALHQVMDAISRLPNVEQRLVHVFRSAIERVAAVAAQGQQANTVRNDVDASHIGLLYVAAAVGLVTLEHAGIVVDIPGATEAATRIVSTSS